MSSYSQSIKRKISRIDHDIDIINQHIKDVQALINSGQLGTTQFIAKRTLNFRLKGYLNLKNQLLQVKGELEKQIF